MAISCAFNVPQDTMLQSAVTEQAIAKACNVDDSTSLSNEELYRKQESMSNSERKVKWSKRYKEILEDEVTATPIPVM